MSHTYNAKIIRNVILFNAYYGICLAGILVSVHYSKNKNAHLRQKQAINQNNLHKFTHLSSKIEETIINCEPSATLTEISLRSLRSKLIKESKASADLKRKIAFTPKFHFEGKGGAILSAYIFFLNDQYLQKKQIISSLNQKIDRLSAIAKKKQGQMDSLNNQQSIIDRQKNACEAALFETREKIDETERRVTRKNFVAKIVGYSFILFIYVAYLSALAIKEIKNIYKFKLSEYRGLPNESKSFFETLQYNLKAQKNSLLRFIIRSKVYCWMMTALVAFIFYIYIYRIGGSKTMIVVSILIIYLYIVAILENLSRRTHVLCRFIDNCNNTLRMMGNENSFCLYLRNFSSDNRVFNESLLDTVFGTFNDVEFNDFDHAINNKFVVSHSKSNYPLYQYIKETAPIICLANNQKHKLNEQFTMLYTDEDTWRHAVCHLIDRASFILLYISEMTDGVIQELEIIGRSDLYFKTILVIESPFLLEEPLIKENLKHFRYFFHRNEIMYKFQNLSEYRDEIRSLMDLTQFVST